jgi:hypothetical protein
MHLGLPPVKHIINWQWQFLVAWYSAYPISETCITPYRVAEAAADPSKRLFNRRHSDLRTSCTENLCGMRVLKLLRCKYEYSRKMVIACCVLHNIGILWADRVPEDGDIFSCAESRSKIPNQTHAVGRRGLTQ